MHGSNRMVLIDFDLGPKGDSPIFVDTKIGTVPLLTFAINSDI
jgi:hypothetical protein